MSEIQDARDVLARWRDTASPAPWKYDAEQYFVEDSAESTNAVGVDMLPEDGLLIVGTAGNLDLLDAIELTLAEGSRYWAGNPVRQHAQRIAVAILSADERMRS
jgi:hypothetical protein